MPWVIHPFESWKLFNANTFGRGIFTRCSPTHALSGCFLEAHLGERMGKESGSPMWLTRSIIEGCMSPNGLKVYSPGFTVTEHTCHPPTHLKWRNPVVYSSDIKKVEPSLLCGVFECWLGFYSHLGRGLGTESWCLFKRSRKQPHRDTHSLYTGHAFLGAACDVTARKASPELSKMLLPYSWVSQSVPQSLYFLYSLTLPQILS